MTFPPLGNSDHVVVSVSIDFQSNSQWDAPFYCIAYDYSCADWYSPHDHLRDIPWEDIFKLSASAVTSDFGEWVQVGIDVYTGLYLGFECDFLFFANALFWASGDNLVLRCPPTCVSELVLQLDSKESQSTIEHLK